MSDWAKYDEMLNQMTRDTFEAPDVKRFYEVRLTVPRAQIIAQQFGLFVRGRRSAWAYLIARCPHMEIKKELLEHETEEMLYDPRCGSDHYTLWVRHGEAVGLTAEQVDNARPLPSTRAALCGWTWLAFNLGWLEGLGGVAVMERVNLDPIIPGGAHQTRAQARWMGDLGLSEEQLPNFKLHREADTDHKGQTMKLLAEHAKTDVQWQGILDASRQSLEFWEVFLGGIARAMESVN